jgi:hypothetical protein
MSSNKVFTFSTQELSKFDGYNYKIWVEKVTLYLMVGNLLNILDSTFAASSSVILSAPDAPTSTEETPATITAWACYGILIKQKEI